MSQVPVIALEHVSFSFGAAPVLEDVTLTVEAGDFLWVVGPNGGGKTTLVRLILGLLQPDSGRIRVFGQRPKQALGRIGYMPQSAEIDARFPVSAGDVVLMGRLGSGRVFGAYSRQDKEAAAKALGAVGLSDVRDRHFAELSGGQQRRVLIARALACEPEILILDEPLANLDVVVEKEIQELLRRLRENLTILMVSHDPALVSQDVQTVVCVNRRVAIHPTFEVEGALLGDLYRGTVRVVRHDRTADGESHDG